ncbi:hypothetical protein [Streptomyces sp. NPDC056796]|uniref:hypothetical protein n=1 Tax=Streptomyces sp. NPDC056796 TaxID=3345947 RepID=UPI0036CD28CE
MAATQSGSAHGDGPATEGGGTPGNGREPGPTLRGGVIGARTGRGPAPAAPRAAASEAGDGAGPPDAVGEPAKTGAAADAASETTTPAGAGRTTESGTEPDTAPDAAPGGTTAVEPTAAGTGTAPGAAAASETATAPAGADTGGGTATGSGTTAGPAPSTPPAPARSRRSWLRAPRTLTASTTAGAAVAVAASPEIPGDDNPSKLTAPMVAAAALGGVLLIAAPFAIALLPGHDGPEPTAERAAGYEGPGVGPDGVVPSAEQGNGDVATAGSAGGGKASAGAPPALPGTGAAAAAPAGSGDPAARDTGTGTVEGSAKGPDGASEDGSTTAPGSGTSGTGTSGSGTGTGTTGSGVTVAENKAAATQAPAGYLAWNGPHCSSEGASYHEYGSSTTPNDGDQWTTHTGGYSKNGCSGRFRSMPMSGSNSDTVNKVVFSWRTGGVTTGNCRVSVFVPNDSNAKHVGGNPSYYTVHNGSGSSSAQVGSFNVNQVGNLGKWVSGPTVRITGGNIALVLHDRGKDWNSKGATDAHHAVDAVGVSCTT